MYKIGNPHISRSKKIYIFVDYTMCASSKNGEMGLFRPDLDSVLRLKSNF